MIKMGKPELNPKIFEFLKKKLAHVVAESTIRPAITRIRSRNPTLTLNAAAEIFARNYRTSVQRYWSADDRASFGTIIREEAGPVYRERLRKVQPPRKRTKPNKRTKVLNEVSIEGSLLMENEDKWDVFICHASEDKEAVVRPLYNALTDTGLKVWYDESTLKLGDRLLSSIGKGIAKSGYGIVVLSENFFKKDWPQRELEGLAAKELEGQKVILPIWHKVDAKFVRSKSPILANVVAASTDEGIAAIVEKVLAVIRPNITKETASSRQPAKSYTQNEAKQSAKSDLQTNIEWLQFIDEDGIKEAIKTMDFKAMKQMFVDVLDAIALFDIDGTGKNRNVFYFINEAILQKNKQEGAELFEILLRWYFETSTPSCQSAIRQIIATLTRLSYLKEAVLRTRKTSDFVAEFGRSNSFEVAGENAEILQNVKTLLSDSDCSKIVDFALTNGQIKSSWRARDYLIKLLPYCEGKANPEKLQKLYDMLTR